MFPLLRFFSVACLVSIVATTVLLGWLHQSVERAQLLEIGESNHVALTQSLANALLPQFRELIGTAKNLETEALKMHPDLAALYPEVLSSLRNTQVVKLKLYEPSGRTIFSTDPGQVGKDYRDNPAFISALHGSPKSELTHRERFSTFDKEIENRDVLSSYIALRSSADAPIEGVLEVYSDVTDWVKYTDRQSSIVTAGTVVAFFILYSVLHVIVRRANRILRSQYEQLQRSEGELRIAATVFESQEGMIVTDPRGTIMRVNKAFTSITGYLPEEAIGRTPRFLRSGLHTEAFYAEMWSAIDATGSWRGEILNRNKDGATYPEWLTITAVTSENGDITHYVGTMVDISERKAIEEEIKNLAFYDPLTRVANRRLLFDRLDQALGASARSGREGALLFIDLDRFKSINDSLGHLVGDLLLQEVARRVQSCVRESDTVARIGGDEFVVMLENLGTEKSSVIEEARLVANKILVTLNAGYTLNGRECVATPSIGISVFNGREHSPKELIHQADLAMYQAKNDGRNTLRFYDKTMLGERAD